MSHNSMLCLYKLDFTKLELQGHTQTPVSNDCRESRMGGGVFDIGDSLYRVSQNNCNGYGFNLMKVEVLTEQKYKESLVYKIEASFSPIVRSTHHFDCIQDVYVTDFFSLD